jgi:hypothetical protein
MVIIPNTLELSTLWVSEAFEGEVEANHRLARETEYGPIPFGEDDRLEQEKLFPNSLRARLGPDDH